MVNAGAIACSGLIHEAKGDGAFEYIRPALGRFAGRELDVDEAVYASESATGDRNRAIGYLLRNSGVITDDVSRGARRLFPAMLGAGDGARHRDHGGDARQSRHQSRDRRAGDDALRDRAHAVGDDQSGMYDYAGEWIYRVGIPAKSGVGGGILAALPARLGLGSYSPRLDKHGNSVRGIKVCEALSPHYDLHMLNRSDDARNSHHRRLRLSARARRAAAAGRMSRNILAAHHQEVRVIELVGTLSFSNVDYVSRQLAARPRPQFVIFDLRRVAAITRAGAPPARRRSFANSRISASP